MLLIMDIRRLPTNTPLDKILNGGVECGVVTNIYGPAGSGKTNISMLTALSVKDQKILYIDTEGGFSLERFNQIGGQNVIKNLLIMEPQNWVDQCEKINMLETIVKKENVGLVVVDSLVALYRLEMNGDNFQKINRELALQYLTLSKLARKYSIPVIVTNQVYGHGEDVEIISNMIAKYWSKAIIELRRLDRENHRMAIVIKHRSIPEGKKVEFVITKNGIKEVGKFDIF